MKENFAEFFDICKIRMNKRGEEESSPILGTIAAGVAILALVLVGGSVYLYGGEILNKFRLLPDISIEKESPQEGDFLVKFEISNQKIYYYSGVKWVELKPGKSIETEGYKISESELKSAFNKYYFYGLVPREDTIFLEKDKVFGLGSFHIYRFKNGEIAFSLTETRDIVAPHKLYYNVGLDDRLFECKVEIGILWGLIPFGSTKECNEISIIKGEIGRAYRAVINYRDEKLIKGEPIKLIFKKTEQTVSDQELSFCVEKRYDTDLVINLRRPLSEGETCPKPGESRNE